MSFLRPANRVWLPAAEVVLLGVGIASSLLSLSTTRASLSTTLRVPHPSRTYFLGQGGGQIPRANYAKFASWRERRDVFVHVGAFSVWGPVDLATESQSIIVDAAWIGKSMSSFLPQRMAAGRPLVDPDFSSGSKNVLISEHLARELGLRSPAGSLVQSNWGVFHVVGVLPGWARFPYPVQPDILIPSVLSSQGGPYTVLGETRPGVTREQAERMLNSAARQGGAQLSTPALLVSMKASLDPGSVRISEYGLVLGLLTLFLLIATASLIELLDAARGKRERSIKLALGATNTRLALERTLEVSFVCILSAALAGLFVAVGRPWLAQAWSSDWVTVPRMDGFTLASLGGLLLFVCLAVSAAPVLITCATQAYAALKEERASTSRGAQRTRMAIITLQVAVSIAFGLGAAKLAGGLHALAAEPLGMDVANIWDGSLDLPVQYTRADNHQSSSRAQQVMQARGQAPAIQEQLRAKLQSLPGVAEVCFSSEGPVVSSHFVTMSGVAPGGTRPSPANSADLVPVTYVDPHYLQLLGSHLLAGRYFTPADTPGPPFDGNPVILSEPLARKLFGNANPVGKQIVYLRAGEPTGYFSRVVGVVPGMRTLGLNAPRTPEIFVPEAGLPTSLALRARRSATIPFREVQQAVRDTIPGARVEAFEPLRERLDSELATPRQRLGLLALFAAISAAVAAFGLASVLLVIIKERDLEIGIRRALGASDRDLAAALLKRVLPWVGLGLAVGLAFPLLYPAPLGVGVAAGRAAAVWSGVAAIAAMLALIAVSLWLPLRKAFRRPINDLLRTE